MRRRYFLLGALGLALAACRKRSPPPPLLEVPDAAAPPTGGAWRELSFDPAPDIPEGERALLLVPDAPSTAPILIALHGHGETGQGLDVGAHAWPHEYALDRMHRRLLAPPLTGADLQDMGSPERLKQLNASLEASPYRGIAVACPYTPDLRDHSVQGAAAFGRFVVDKLLARARAELGSKADRGATGIDGVSMGGRLSLLLGFSYPEVFGTVGALQPAIRVEEASMIADLAKAAMARAPFSLRLVSSEADPFLPAVRAASDRLREAGVAHECLVVPGTHGYAFNRGPGGAELLLWHERVLRGLRGP
jgi:iron(III)-salmochelin esterase